MNTKWRKQTDAIGRGTHAAVYLAVRVDSRRNSSKIAVKSKNIDYACDLRHEANVLRQLRGCPYVIQCYGEDVSTKSYGRGDYNLLLEYAPGGNLGHLIYRDRKFEESDVAFYAYQLLMGLLHVHDNGFVHCDLKPENVLVFPTGQLLDGKLKFLLKLADFGVSTRAGKKDKICYNEDEDEYDDYEPFDPNQCRGSLVYAAPAYLTTGIHQSSDDIWSLGCILAEMITGDSPWLCKDTNDLIFQIQNDKPAMPENISGMAKDFLRKCFYRKDCGDDRERWTARMLLTHPFILNNKDVAFLHENDDDDYRVMYCPENPLGCGDDQWVSTKDLFIP